MPWKAKSLFFSYKYSDLLYWVWTFLLEKKLMWFSFHLTSRSVKQTVLIIVPVTVGKAKAALPRPSIDNGCQTFRIIKPSASLCSLITPHKDPWVASVSTLRLKWMFTSPNDYLSRHWVNATASVLSAARRGYTHSHRNETSVWGLCTSCVSTHNHL